MGEWSTFTDDKESSDEDGKDSKKEPKKKLVLPSPLVSRPPAEIIPPAPRPPLFEQLVAQGKPEKDDEDKEKDTDEKDDAAESTTAGEPEAVEGETLPAENAGEQPVAEQVAEAAAEAVPDDEWEGELRLHDQPEASAEQPLQAAEDEEETTALSQSRSTGSAFAATPLTTAPPSTSPQAPSQGPSFGWNTAPSPNTGLAFNTAPAAPGAIESLLGATKETERDAEKRGLRKGLVAGFLTGYVVRAYIANRKRERYEKTVQKQINQRDEQIANFQREQQRLTEKMAAQTAEYRSKEQLAKNQAARFEKPRPAPELPKQQPNSISLTEKATRLFCNPAGTSSALSAVTAWFWTNTTVLSTTLFVTVKPLSVSNSASNSVMMSLPPWAVAHRQGPPLTTALGLSLPRPSTGRYAVWAGPTPGSGRTVDLKTPPASPRNRVTATLFGPWVWTAVAILIIIYFIAALA
jgi:hypothetical protein